MKNNQILMIILMGFISLPVLSQTKLTNTLEYSDKEGSPKATIEDVSWIEGSWQGEAFGGIAEEIWSAPMGGSMMASFRLISDNEVSFYELETITEEEGTLILRLKHFNGNLTGWEEKDETIDFKLVKITKGKVYFDGMTFERVSANEMNVYVVLEDQGKKEEVKFNYKKRS